MALLELYPLAQPQADDGVVIRCCPEPVVATSRIYVLSKPMPYGAHVYTQGKNPLIYRGGLIQIRRLVITAQQ